MRESSQLSLAWSAAFATAEWRVSVIAHDQQEGRVRTNRARIARVLGGLRGVHDPVR